MSKTKTILGNALKQLTNEKPFDKISVSDISSKCNLNRQTFYYHFQDKYECLEWIYAQECLSLLMCEMNAMNWEKCIEKTLIIMANDKEFYFNTIKENPTIFIKLFIHTSTSLFKNMIDNYDGSNKSSLNTSFISEFLTMGIAGIIINWVLRGMKVPPSQIADQFKIMAKEIRESK